jgi:hypothetical protein
MFEDFFNFFLKGLLLAILYFEITKANDTTLENTMLFVSLYIAMIIGANLASIDTNVVTSAFLTKTIFTLVDERIRRKNNDHK